MHRLVLGPVSVEKLLPQIKPYLIVKRRQAEIVMEALPVIRAQQGFRHEPDFVDTMEEYVKELRELHGKKYVPLTRVPAE